jgi:hypothetical protein
MLQGMYPQFMRRLMLDPRDACEVSCQHSSHKREPASTRQDTLKIAASAPHLEASLAVERWLRSAELKPLAGTASPECDEGPSRRCRRSSALSALPSRCLFWLPSCSAAAWKGEAGSSREPSASLLRMLRAHATATQISMQHTYICGCMRPEAPAIVQFGSYEINQHTAGTAAELSSASAERSWHTTSSGFPACRG